jgi:hypothetical protein
MSWWLARPKPLPHVSSATMEMAIPGRLAQMRPQPPAVPTIRGLPPGHPMLVPGVDHVRWISSPTLSDDLKTLVYLSVGRPGANADLYITQRATIDEPFQSPALIEACSSPEKEAYPALSSDGLELIYTVIGTPSRLMHSRRLDHDADFGAPQPLQFDRNELSDCNLDGPQFVGANKIRFAASDTPFTHRTQWAAERESANAPFRVVAKLPFNISWPRYFVNSNGRRAYYSSEDGVFLTACSLGGGFAVPEKLLPASAIGPIIKRFDSTIWVAPQEDVIIYCSPGIDTPDSGSHQLWMIDVSGRNKT